MLVLIYSWWNVLINLHMLSSYFFAHLAFATPKKKVMIMSNMYRSLKPFRHKFILRHQDVSLRRFKRLSTYATLFTSSLASTFLMTILNPPPPPLANCCAHSIKHAQKESWDISSCQTLPTWPGPHPSSLVYHWAQSPQFQRLAFIRKLRLLSASMSQRKQY